MHWKTEASQIVMPRRDVLKTMGAAAVALMSPAVIRPGFAQEKTIKLGAPIHRTGIGASYGRWYERTAAAAVELVNASGGINGMKVEMIVEDDGTDPKRGTELIEKFATEYKVDGVFAICSPMLSQQRLRAPESLNFRISSVRRQAFSPPARLIATSSNPASPTCMARSMLWRPGSAIRWAKR